MPPDHEDENVADWPRSIIGLDGEIEGAPSTGSTVSDDVAVFVTSEVALSFTDAVNVAEQLPVSALFAVNTMALDPSAARLLDEELRVPQSEFEVE